VDKRAIFISPSSWYWIDNVRVVAQVKLHLDGRLYVPLGNDPEVLDDWPLHRAKQVHFTRLYVGACWQGKLVTLC